MTMIRLIDDDNMFGVGDKINIANGDDDDDKALEGFSRIELL